MASPECKLSHISHIKRLIISCLGGWQDMHTEAEMSTSPLTPPPPPPHQRGPPVTSPASHLRAEQQAPRLISTGGGL